ncbi:MAG TPA: BamA/TamA family outer membrane protein [Chitinophagaceae bacterium]|nr:BamA/TamA family outer membrane protein [Chitinophagaceae bacterium]
MRIPGLQISVLICLLAGGPSFAQKNYNLQIQGVDMDATTILSRVAIKTEFNSRFECSEYINQLPSRLQAKGYVTASIDSIVYDSSGARVRLFMGQAYRWAKLDTRQTDPQILRAVGWDEKAFSGKPIDFKLVDDMEENILDHLADNGHPFAKVYLDSVQLENENISARLQVERGPLYHIDSIRVYGNAHVSGPFLSRYLDIPNKSIYNREKILAVGKKIQELSYVEQERPADLSLLGTGSVLNVYLKPKQSSQFNVLIGFLPNSDQQSNKKLLLTGEANINLKNMLGSGETIGLNWQQLQNKSPRLNLVYQHPFIFNSPFGFDFLFEMFKKDSSYVNVNLQLGAGYILNTNQAGKIFLQRFQTIVNGVNKAYLLQNRSLPNEGDVSTYMIGFDYEYNNTDYRYNPRKGNELRVITSVGSRTIKKNNEILALKDPGDPSFDFGVLYDTVKLKTSQFRLKFTGSHYFPLGKGRSVIKTALNGGWFQSANAFRNELFQLGGYKLLRGFDEESEYLSHYAIATLEYHYLIVRNSYFYVLADGGMGWNRSQNVRDHHSYFGTGLGLAIDTKAGIFNLAWAVGKRNDLPFNLRKSKIHIGFVNYF